MSKNHAAVSYKPEYCDAIVGFFDEPHYTIKDMTITKPDGTQIDKTEMEANPPRFLSDFAKSIGVSLISYRDTFGYWAERNPEFKKALQVAKELCKQRFIVNGTMNLYSTAFAIFTLKNIAGWRDKADIAHSGEIKGQNTQIVLVNPPSVAKKTGISRVEV